MLQEPDRKAEMIEDDEILNTPLPAQSAAVHRAVGIWVMLGAAGFILVAVAIALAGFYLVKQREAKLEARVAALEQTVANIGQGQAALPPGAAPQPAKTSVSSGQPNPGLISSPADVATLAQKVQDLQAASGTRDTLMQTVGNLQSTVVGLQGNLQTPVAIGRGQSYQACRARSDDGRTPDRKRAPVFDSALD